MKEGDKNNERTKWVHLRVTPKEHRLIHAHFSASTCRSLSEYIRAALLDYPLVTKYRNASQDDLLEKMGILNRELNAIGSNINQSIKRLHSLKDNEKDSWAKRSALESISLGSKITEIKLLLHSIAERWLR